MHKTLAVAELRPRYVAGCATPIAQRRRLMGLYSLSLPTGRRASGKEAGRIGRYLPSVQITSPTLLVDLLTLSQAGLIRCEQVEADVRVFFDLFLQTLSEVFVVFCGDYGESS